MSTITTTALLDDLYERQEGWSENYHRSEPQPEIVKAARQKFTLLFSRYASWPKPNYIAADNTGSVEINWDTDDKGMDTISNCLLYTSPSPRD